MLTAISGAPQNGRLTSFVSFVAFVVTLGGISAADRLDQGIVWQPATGFMDRVRATCDRRKPSDYSACLIGLMSGAGAPPPAVRFARRLHTQSDGVVGIARDFAVT